jgi:cobalt-zinc-cadmium efflux system membrane fusion protein
MRRPPRIVGILAALALLAAACEKNRAPEGAEPAKEGARQEGKPERIELSPKALETLSLETAPVTRQPIRSELRATAVIKPNENRLAHVSPRIPGKAIEVKAVLGDLVEPGQVLAELDSLELGEKKSAFLQARTNLEVARRNFEREERLFKQQISSEREYLESKGELERSEAAYRAAREALRLVGLGDDEINRTAWGGSRHPLSHFPLVAPFAGTVIEQHVALGELVRPEDKPYAIADLTTLWTLLDVYEKDLSRVGVGADARVNVEAFPDETFPGRITYLSHVLAESTRTAQARVEIDNRKGRLRPGMFATATIDLPGDGGAEAITVPEAAIQQIHGKPTAFVEAAPGSFEARTLALGGRSGDFVEVKAGLSAGEKVVTKGAFSLKSALLKDELAGED